MIIDLIETKIHTLGQLRAILHGTETLKFTLAEDAQARCKRIELGLNRFCYKQLNPLDRGLLVR